MRRIFLLALAVGCGSAATPAESQNLPIMSGTWSAQNCSALDRSEKRIFSPGLTATPTTKCRLEVKSVEHGFYRMHLACKSGQSIDDGEVSITVRSPTSINWIDECVMVPYHFCHR